MITVRQSGWIFRLSLTKAAKTPSADSVRRHRLDPVHLVEAVARFGAHFRERSDRPLVRDEAENGGVAPSSMICWASMRRTQAKPRRDSEWSQVLRDRRSSRGGKSWLNANSETDSRRRRDLR